MIGTKYDLRVGSCPWFWMWFFSGFYLFYKGLIGHGLVWFLLCWTFIVTVIYIFMARNLVYEKMVKTGQITPNYAMGNVVNVNL